VWRRWWLRHHGIQCGVGGPGVRVDASRPVRPRVQIDDRDGALEWRPIPTHHDGLRRHATMRLRGLLLVERAHHPRALLRGHLLLLLLLLLLPPLLLLLLLLARLVIQVLLLVPFFVVIPLIIT